MPRIGIDELLTRFMIVAIESALAASRGNVNAAATVLKLERSTLHERCRRFGIDPKRWRPSEAERPPVIEGKRNYARRTSALYMTTLKKVIEALVIANGNRTDAAELLGVSVRTVANKARQAESLGFDVPVSPFSRVKK